MPRVIDWTPLVKKYGGKWVTFKEDERTVIAVGKTAREAWEKAQAKGYKKPILTKMPEGLVTYVGSGR